MLARQEDDQSPVASELASVKVAYIDNRSGQVLRNDLINTLTPGGEPSRPKYTLTIRIEEPFQNLAFQRNNSVSFVGYTVNAYWSLVDAKGVAVYSSASSSSQNYAITNSQYASAVSAQNTRDLIMLDISQDIRNKLAQYLLSQHNAATGSKK